MAAASAHVVEGDLHGFVDGQLTVERRNQVVAWLGGNPQDEARVHTWRSQNDAILAAFGKIAAEPLPVSLSLNVSAAARFTAAPAQMPALRLAAVKTPARNSAGPAEHSRTARQRPGVIGFLLGMSVAFALAAMALVAAERFRPQLSAVISQARAASLAERAAEAHAAFSAGRFHALEITAGRPGQIQRFMAERAGLNFPPPDLSAEGLALMGARIVPGAAAPLALLFYEGSAGERASLLLGARAGSAARSDMSAEIGTISAQSINGRAAELAIATNSGAVRAKNLADAAARQLSAAN